MMNGEKRKPQSMEMGPAATVVNGTGFRKANEVAKNT